MRSQTTYLSNEIHTFFKYFTINVFILISDDLQDTKQTPIMEIFSLIKRIKRICFVMSV